MPTAPKLFGAFAFLMVGFFAAEMLKPSFPDGYNFGMFSVICGILGIMVGWTVMGRGLRQGTTHAMAAGVRASLLLLFWGMLAFSIREMLVRSIDRRYQGIQDALEGMFDIMVEYGSLIVSSGTTIIVLIIGGMLAGAFANWAAVRWN